MDSSNSAVDFRVLDLLNSIHPEDRDLAEKAKQTIIEVIHQLKPILRHICVPTNFRGGNDFACSVGSPQGVLDQKRAVELLKYRVNPDERELVLFLAESGDFFSAGACSHLPNHWHGRVTGHANSIDGFPWSRVPFGELLESLKKVLDEAVAKREAYLTTLNSRRTMLDQILEVVNSTAR